MSSISAGPSLESICTVSPRKSQSLSMRSRSSFSSNTADMQASCAHHALYFREKCILLHRFCHVTIHPRVDAHLAIAGHGVGGHGDDGGAVGAVFFLLADGPSGVQAV